jgi:hypothetical protein
MVFFKRGSEIVRNYRVIQEMVSLGDFIEPFVCVTGKLARKASS